MNFVEKQASVVRAISAKTEDGIIKWKQSPETPSTLYCELGDKIINMYYLSYNDNEGDPTTDVVLDIYNANGSKASTIRDPMLFNEPVSMSGYSGWFSFMTNLYEMAERQASGAEDAIDEVRRLLGMDDDFDF